MVLHIFLSGTDEGRVGKEFLARVFQMLDFARSWWSAELLVDGVGRRNGELTLVTRWRCPGQPFFCGRHRPHVRIGQESRVRKVIDLSTETISKVNARLTNRVVEGSSRQIRSLECRQWLYTLQLQNISFFGDPEDPMSVPRTRPCPFTLPWASGASHPKTWRAFQDWAHDVRDQPYVEGISDQPCCRSRLRRQSSTWEMWHIYYSDIKG
ncbi:hypothetical protein CAPTEDRAFT_188834 [Capitella teleta]|uniref:Uncharacterized protein n=1 Tax=Capitella teleta TaxID=283909 RepID=R7T7P6_CAPTE|nr:hypothetical protein CAPTEDRAFT_188834 [Capitella teleta]|eukprot:ELT89453.1 hypothetical protein CAPTEDRAFT_188834 [Capitella teleta]